MEYWKTNGPITDVLSHYSITLLLHSSLTPLFVVGQPAERLQGPGGRLEVLRVRGHLHPEPEDAVCAESSSAKRFLRRADIVRKIRTTAKARWMALTVMLSRMMKRGSAS